MHHIFLLPIKGLFRINRIRSILLFLQHGGRPILFFRSWSPFSKGTRVCFFSFCLRVEMFFSFYLMFYLLLKYWGAKLEIIFQISNLLDLKFCIALFFYNQGINLLLFLRKKSGKILSVSKKVLSLHSQFEERLIFLSGSQLKWPIRLSVRTQDFHS